MKKWIFLLIILLFIIGCTKKPIVIENKTNDMSLDKEQELQQENENLQKQVQDLQKKLDKYTLTKLTSKVDLYSWSEDEILAGLAKYDSKYKNASWFNYKYGDGYYYDLEGPIYKDPFYKIRYRDTGRELNVSHLRIYDLVYDLNKKYNDQEKYTQYVDMILRETRLNTELVCYQQKKCRDFNLIICVKNYDTYYSIFKERYVFTAVNDKGLFISTFEKFYCEPEDKFTTVTTQAIYQLEKQNTFLVNFFKKYLPKII